MTINEMFDELENKVRDTYIVTLKYKYDFEEKYTIENQILVYDSMDDSYVWQNDWNEGQTDVEVLGYICLDDVDTTKLEPREDSISRNAVMKCFKKWQPYMATRLLSYEQELSKLPSVTPQQTSWIPIKTRPMTEEEKEEIGHEYAFMYDCPLPDDGQDVLITDCYGDVEIDTFCRDGEGVYFENNCDDGEVIAWMPLPEPYKTESEVNADDE